MKKLLQGDEFNAGGRAYTKEKTAGGAIEIKKL
jgi:hypothetical protein